MQKLPMVWEDLVLKSKNTDASLGIVKRKFTQVYGTFSYFQVVIQVYYTKSSVPIKVSLL